MISSILSFVLGKALRFPAITGLLLFSIVGMGWSYYQGQSGANEKHKAAKADAILKDAKENTRLSEAAQDIIERAKDATDKANKKSNSEIDTIKSLSPMQCLDIKLADIGLL